MPRKKRGNARKAVAARKGKNAKAAAPAAAEEEPAPSSIESEESSSSGTPKSCNTPVEMEKPQMMTLVQHKKFGKFRCLITEDVTKIELSGNENEVQQDSVIDAKQVESEKIEDIELVETKAADVIVKMHALNVSTDSQMSELSSAGSESKHSESIYDSQRIDDKLEIMGMDYISADVISDIVGVPEITITTSASPSDEDIILQEVTASDIKESEVSTNKEKDNETSNVRRSSRIRSISVLKKNSKGRGLVRPDKLENLKFLKSQKASESDCSENSNSGPPEVEKLTPLPLDSPTFAVPIAGYDSNHKPVKVKSRWRRSSEMEMGGLSAAVQHAVVKTVVEEVGIESPKTVQSPVYDEEMENRLKQYVNLPENEYKTERASSKEAKKMICDCFLTQEEIERGEYGCGEDCLNRLLMIECGSQCTIEDRCTNKRFQKQQYAHCEVFKTEKKGYGIRALTDIKVGEFILEYVGEVLDTSEFKKRAKEYSEDNNRHYYFMALRADAIIDATQKGNISRFINHSCEPNAETQKWTVNGELRIGFFSKRKILVGEEITFDYQFQRYGKEAQKCYCEAPTCRGWIGEEPEEDEDEEEEDDDEEESESEKEEKETPESTKESEGVTDETPKEPKPPKKKQIKKRKDKIRKDIFEDLDLDEAIEMLSVTGLKNQAHTLKLSRLMVRAKDIGPRMQLLKLIKQGDLPCQRLFLDYHGLRLIHGWMCDVGNMNVDELQSDTFRLEILEVLNSLPITNKTTLQDSKVLSTVEKWSSGKLIDESSPKENDSEDSDSKDVKKEENSDVKDEEVKDTKISKPEESTQDADTEVVAMDVEPKSEVDGKPDEVKDEPVETKVNLKEVLVQMCMKLLERWYLLKEAYRIPKKERIEQMKEHEREADRGYKSDALHETNRYSWKSERYRLHDKEKRKSKDPLDYDRCRKGSRLDDKSSTGPKLTKQERRQLFALQVQQEEEDRRRKQQQEMWQQMIAFDPRLASPFSNPAAGYQYYWGGTTAVPWQNYSPNIPPPNITGPSLLQHPNQAITSMQGTAFTAAVNLLTTPPPIHTQSLNPLIPNPSMPMHTPPPMHKPPPVHNPVLLPAALSQPPPLTLQNPPLPVHNPLPNHSPALPMQNAPIHKIPPLPVHNPPLPMHNPPLPTQPPSHPSSLLPNPNLVTASKLPQMPSVFTSPPPVISNQSSMFDAALPTVQSIPSLPVEKPQTEITYSTTTMEETPVVFPPPVKLPPKWKCARDKYGRPYYYHIKIRISQWEPPEFLPPPPEPETELADSSSSTESSSISSDTSSDSDDDSETDDTKLLLEINEKLNKETNKGDILQNSEIMEAKESPDDVSNQMLSKRQKHKREGLVTEIIISPRTEEDRLQFLEDVKRYKETKEQLKHEKEQLLMEQRGATGKHIKLKPRSSGKSKRYKTGKSKAKTPSTIDMNSEQARKIKESFRSNMAVSMVQYLNVFRKQDCRQGRITNTEDFKHLARKLTHFVMLKELKHCQNVEDLTCNDSVKMKAKDFVKKYMSKFGEIYIRPKDEAD